MEMTSKAGLAVEDRTPPSVSIIFVNWNSSDYLIESLNSIYSNTVGIEFEIIIVDNASRDSDLTKLRELPRELTLIASETNLGFAKANNLAAQRSHGKYLLFLNPDTKVVGQAVANMVLALESVGATGIIGCRLLNGDNSIQTSCIQRFPTILNQMLDVELFRSKWPTWSFWGISALFSISTRACEVDVVSGACLLIDRDTFLQLGGFSSKYFMYAEDVDLCYRTRTAGRKVYYTPEATVIHYGGGTSRERCGNAWIAVMQREAILKFLRLTRGTPYANTYRLATGLNAACRLGVLMLIYPFKRLALEEQIPKWLSVFKWAVGVGKRVALEEIN